MIEAGYGLDALNEIAEAVEAPSITLDFKEWKPKKPS